MRIRTQILSRRLLVLAVGFLVCLPAALAAVDKKTAQRIDGEIEKNRADVVKIRRFIHMNPELGNREFETARQIASKLEALGLEVRTGVAKTGVTALLRGAQPGASIALRADMDALPIQEATGLSYRSLNPGVMHACGHDVHASIVLGTAMVLSAMKDKIRGSVTFIFQPAEEGPPEGEDGGADLMIREGVLDNPPVNAIIGFHVWPENVGQVLFAPGFITASADAFRVTVKGKSAHGARPHEGIDAIVIAAEMIEALQTIISRSIDPTDPAVLTIGLIQGGVRSNVIADKVSFEGTVRALSDANRKKIPALMDEIVKNVCEMNGAGYEFEYKPGLLSVYNNPELAASMAPIMTGLLGKDNVVEWKPQLIAEDFSAFARRIPGFYFFLGVKNPTQASAAPLHSPGFSPDERAIPLGIRILSHLLIDALEEQSSMATGVPKT